MWDIGDKTHYNQTIDSSSVRDCWNACLAKTNVPERREKIEEFNTNNRYNHYDT